MGSEQSDAMRNFTGFVGLEVPSTVSGAFYDPKLNILGWQASSSKLGGLAFDPSRVVPTADENRMKNRASIGIIKVS